MRIVEFDYKPEFASTMGIDHTHQTGNKSHHNSVIIILKLIIVPGECDALYIVIILNVL